MTKYYHTMIQSYLNGTHSVCVTHSSLHTLHHIHSIHTKSHLVIKRKKKF